MKKINWNILQELQEKFWIDTLEWQDMILKELKKQMLETALEWELWGKRTKLCTRKGLIVKNGWLK